jgi:hypothetical protein
MTTAASDHFILLALANLTRDDAGYEIAGLRGWAVREDLERMLGGGIPERLAKLHARGFADRYDVRVPGTGRPVWAYRITQTGANHAAGDTGPMFRVHPVGGIAEARVFVPARAQAALQALRTALTDPESGYIAGESGWRTMQELIATWRMNEDGEPGYDPRTDDEDPRLADPEPWRGDVIPETGYWGSGWPLQAEREEGLAAGWDPWRGAIPWSESDMSGRFFAEDVTWLLNAGLAKKQGWVPPWRRKPVLLYRITTRGISTPILDWREPA